MRRLSGDPSWGARIRLAPQPSPFFVKEPEYYPIQNIMTESPWWAPAVTEEETKQVQRWRFKPRSKVGLTIVAILILFMGWSVTFNAPVEPNRVLSSGAIIEPPSLDSLIASCTGITYWPENLNIGLVTSDTPHNYKQYPPTSGTWTDTVSAPKFYRYPSTDVLNVPTAVGNLWEGDIVVWYAPGASDQKKRVLEELALSKPGGVDYVVAPWPNTLERLWVPGTRDIILTAWGISQECDTPSLMVFEEFATAAQESHTPGTVASVSTVKNE